jgi:translocation and assembly module TamB
LALLRPFLSNLQDLSGELSGRLNITGSLNDPKADGSMEIRNASFHLGSLASSAEFVTGQLQIENSSLQIKSLAGEIEPGRFELSGVCHFPAPWKPAWNLTLRGERIPVLVDSLSTLLVEGELQASGGEESGSITGVCRFVDSVVRRQIEVLPLFSATGSPSLGLESHAAIIQNLAPYPHWSIQLKIGGEDPIRLTGQNLAGSIFPDLAILGTVDRPVPVGTISVAGLEVKTPGGPLFSERAEICFYPDQPWQPFVYARATGYFVGSIVEATAFGPLSEGKWCLRSMDPDPLLPQAATMLLRGGAPAFLMPAGLLGPSEFFLMTENQKHSLQPVPLRIEDQTLVGGGMRFQDSMDFSLRGGLLPAGSFEQGFQWR